jgi:hypothetical protein
VNGSLARLALILEGSVSHLDEAAKEYSTSQSILGFSFVQTDLNPATTTRPKIRCSM